MDRNEFVNRIDLNEEIRKERELLYNSMCNLRDDNGDYLFDEEWIVNNLFNNSDNIDII